MCGVALSVQDLVLNQMVILGGLVDRLNLFTVNAISSNQTHNIIMAKLSLSINKVELFCHSVRCCL